MTVHGRRVRRRLLAARAAQFEPRVRTIQEWIDAADDDMRAWTVFCNTHCAWCVDDLTPVVAALEIDSKPFFGPVRRGDGVYQLYVELPYHHYLEIDSLTFKGTVGTPAARAWAEAV